MAALSWHQPDQYHTPTGYLTSTRQCCFAYFNWNVKSHLAKQLLKLTGKQTGSWYWAEAAGGLPGRIQNIH
jgi:hypothetical protein